MVENENTVITSENVETNVDNKETTQIVETKNVNEEVENDDDTDVEFEDSTEDNEDEGSSDSQESKKQYTAKERREFNRKKSEEKRLAREKEIERSSYTKGIKTALGGKNPFTGELIETEDDVQLYEDMKEMKEQGLDPESTSDYRKFIKERTLRQQEEQIKAQQEQEKYRQMATARQTKETAEFKAKYPQVNIGELIKSDNKFAKTLQMYVNGGMTLTQGYELYMEIKNGDVAATANKIAQKTIQASMASPGSQSIGGNLESTKPISVMDNEEFKEMYYKKYGIKI